MSADAAASRVSRTGLIGALRRVWQPLVFALLVGTTLWAYFTSHLAPGVFGFDFRGTLWEAARALAHGTSPYPLPGSPQLASGNPALYPPFAIAAVVPLSWLPWSLAVGVWTALEIAGAMAGTWLVGVRDWRCYCVVLTSLPFLQGLLYGNLTLLLLLGVGASWHLRHRSGAGGFALGAVVAAKLFLWPLGVWALLQRRFAVSLVAAAAALGLVLVPWAAIGFDGLREYPSLLRSAADLYGPHTSSFVGAGVGAGLSLGIARWLPLLAAFLLLALAAVALRRADGDRRAFAICVLAAIAGSPIVWTYYLVLLVAPIGVMRPRLSWLWGMLPAVYIVDRIHHPAVEGTRPPGTSPFAWGALHVAPSVWQSLGVGALLIVLAGAVLTIPATPRRVVVRQRTASKSQPVVPPG